MDEQMGTEVKSVPGVESGVAAGNPTDGSAAEVKPEASTAPAWMAQLPNDLKGNENLKQYATLGDAIKNLMEEKKTTTPVAEEQKVEKVQYKEFGKKLAQNFDPFGDISNDLKDYFEEKGVAQAEAEGFFDSFTKTIEKASKSMIEKGRDYCEKAVKERWGNDYDTKRALMAKGYQAIGDTDGSLQKALDESGISLSPDVWELLSRVGALVSEDTGSPVRGTGNAAVNTSGCPIDYSKPSI